MSCSELKINSGSSGFNNVLTDVLALAYFLMSSRVFILMVSVCIWLELYAFSGPDAIIMSANAQLTETKA